MNKNIKLILLSSIGGIFENYDFVIFILFAKVLSQNFFSHLESYYPALISTYIMFAVGWIVRPLSGLIQANIGDRIGRKTIFLFNIFMMSFATLMIGCLPSYSQIGIAAPVLLVILRICQGIAMGGEVPCSVIFIYEHTDNKRSVFIVSIFMASLAGGALLGTIIGIVLPLLIGESNLFNWGWRIPFFIGSVLCIVGIFLRLKLSETPIFEDLKKENKLLKQPLFKLFRENKKLILSLLFLVLPAAFYYLTGYLYLPNYLTVHFNYGFKDVFFINLFGLVIYISSIIVIGYLTGRNQFNINKVFIAGQIILLAGTIPAFNLFYTGQLIYLLPFYFICGIGNGAIEAVFCIMLCRAFTPSIRFSGLAVIFNIIAVFAGVLPVIYLFTIKNLSFTMAPAWILTGFVFISLLINFKSIFSKKDKNV